MWIRYVQSQNRRQPIPVRYEVRGWDNLLGAHYDHYHLDYNFYSPNAIPEHIFEVKEGDIYFESSNLKTKYFNEAIYFFYLQNRKTMCGISRTRL